MDVRDSDIGIVAVRVAVAEMVVADCAGAGSSCSYVEPHGVGYSEVVVAG